MFSSFKQDYERMMSTEDNIFKIGDYVVVKKLCDTDGNEKNDYDQRSKDLLQEGKIDFVFGNDENGGNMYGIEGSDYCFNRYELELIEQTE